MHQGVVGLRAVEWPHQQLYWESALDVGLGDLRLATHDVDDDARLGRGRYRQPSRRRSAYRLSKSPPTRSRSDHVVGPVLWPTLRRQCHIAGRCSRRASAGVSSLRAYRWNVLPPSASLTSQSKPSKPSANVLLKYRPGGMSWVVGVLCDQRRGAGGTRITGTISSCTGGTAGDVG